MKEYEVCKRREVYMTDSREFIGSRSEWVYFMLSGSEKAPLECISLEDLGSRAGRFFSLEGITLNGLSFIDPARHAYSPNGNGFYQYERLDGEEMAEFLESLQNAWYGQEDIASRDGS